MSRAGLKVQAAQTLSLWIIYQVPIHLWKNISQNYSFQHNDSIQMITNTYNSGTENLEPV